MKKKILVILGPTAVGKTDLALNLAQKYHGELISCDSRQVYIGLDIGTGKEPGGESVIKKEQGRWIVNGIPIYMYDVCDPTSRFTVKEYVAQSRKVIDDILSKDKLPIIVGGTGFYLKGITEGIPNLGIPVNEALREDLTPLPSSALQEKLKYLSIKSWESLNESDQKNPRRLLRSIENIYMNPYIVTDNEAGLGEKYDVLKIGLSTPRPLLNKRIDLRVDSRIKSGLIEEGFDLFERGLPLQRFRDLGLEYGVLADLIEGKITQDEFSEKLKVKSHQYAKRQMTWFKKQTKIIWFDINAKNFANQVDSEVKNWYDAPR